MAENEDQNQKKRNKGGISVALEMIARMIADDSGSGGRKKKDSGSSPQVRSRRPLSLQIYFHFIATQLPGAMFATTEPRFQTRT